MRITLLGFSMIITCMAFAQEPEAVGCLWGCPTLMMRGTNINFDATALSVMKKVGAKMSKQKSGSITIFSYPKSNGSSRAACLRKVKSIKTYLVNDWKIDSARILSISKPGSGTETSIDIKTDDNFDLPADTKSSECPCTYPSINFVPDKSELTEAVKTILSTAASTLKAHPDCMILINSYPEASKHAQARSEQRLDEVKRYFVEKAGISSDRISTMSDVGAGEKNTVDIKCN